MAAAGAGAERRDRPVPADRATLRLTRRCLEVMAEFRQAVTIVTKNRLVTRDVDVLAGAGAPTRRPACSSRSRRSTRRSPALLEPRTSRPRGGWRRSGRWPTAGIPAGVMVAPVIPGLNEHEIPTILEAAAKAGAQTAGYVMIRLPVGRRPLFEDWLSRHRPDGQGQDPGPHPRRCATGKLNDARFGSRMSGQGPMAELIARVFRVQPASGSTSTSGPGPSRPTAFRRPSRTDRDTATPALRLSEPTTFVRARLPFHVARAFD